MDARYLVRDRGARDERRAPTTAPVRRPLTRAADSEARPLRFSAAATSAAGPRPDNQDSGLASPRLLAVADGVGGNVGGATASAMAVRSMLEDLPSDRWETPETLAEVVRSANRRVGSLAIEVPVLDGMATTVTAVSLSDEGRLTVAHIGDTRAYLARGGQLTALTRDHSVVQAMVDAGSLTAEQATTHPWRSMLLAALHGREQDAAHLEVSALRALPGDRLLLCSDGLWSVRSWQEIQRTLDDEPTPFEAAGRLLDLALMAPTRDNVTVVVADVTAGAAPARPTVVGAAAAPDISRRIAS